ncbi:MAG: TetM/TetW/TetO/TetS family tetracycline resistance ribosomal protection protein, partial [Lachnospiraceae bacterium]|nr:TetM/TetW/TetO/TetS family tetracycline resistance ribosomal protection protein [Lachnospiraceae bacterium]
MNNVVMGILAHVDAGKTTLSECLLYHANVIKTMGRVDKKDAYLDTDEAEKMRGITIYAKQAELNLEGRAFTLLDTPGHVDFSPETERVLQVLDICVLVISGASGVQSHTKTLWKLLRTYNVPTIIFVNKMDQDGTDKTKLLHEIKKELSVDADVFFDGDKISNEFVEMAAATDEALLSEYLEVGNLDNTKITELFNKSAVFPVFFGSALKDIDVDKLISGITMLSPDNKYGDTFGARVFKITRDEAGNRLTHIKVTGGSLKLKDVIQGKTREGEDYSAKINRIYICSGIGKREVTEVHAGDVCTLFGIEETFIGAGLGFEENEYEELLVPVIDYAVKYESRTDKTKVYSYLKTLEEEEPALHVNFDEETGEITVSLMGEVQIEILKETVKKRFLINIDFSAGKILYKETINNKVEGVGHFEPLRHYAEVHLLMEPLPRGEGLIFDTVANEDELARNWQRLILTHLEERVHKGVLTGSPITDMKITLCSGKAHLKHTEGGDFRQATYRAVRMGLMCAESVLLEPYYRFTVEVPSDSVGRVMTILDERHATFTSPEVQGDYSVIEGTGPVSTLNGLQIEINKFTGGLGHFNAVVSGYDKCHNPEEVIESRAYNPDSDLRNPSSSVFCMHGAGATIPWNEVRDYMHIPFMSEYVNETVFELKPLSENIKQELSPDEEEKQLKQIFESTYGTIKSKFDVDYIDNDNVTYAWNGRAKARPEKGPVRRERPEDYDYEKEAKHKHGSNNTGKDKYLLVDGYNVIFAWPLLNDMARTNMDGARTLLQDILCDYQGFTGIKVIVVYDAYKVLSHKAEITEYRNIHVVFTATAQTADAYIERCAYEMSTEHDVTCATS